MINACTKYTSLKWEKLVNRATMEFHYKSCTLLQQLSLTHWLHFASPKSKCYLPNILKYAGKSCIANLAAENLTNYHCKSTDQLPSIDLTSLSCFQCRLQHPNSPCQTLPCSQRYDMIPLPFFSCALEVLTSFCHLLKAA